MDVLVSLSECFKDKIKNIENPYFILRVLENKIESSKEWRRTYAQVSSSNHKNIHQGEIKSKIINVYREFMGKDMTTIKHMISSFKELDKEEYDYWVDQLCLIAEE
jgi:hypothetical protein